MPIIHPGAFEHELKRWTRSDAHRFIRADWRHFAKPGSELEALYQGYERKYRPDQARVPAGNPDGGQWTSEGGGRERTNAEALSAANGANASARDGTKLAQYDIGTLVGQAVIRNGIGRMCFYRFSFGIVMVPGATNLGCLPRLPSAAAVHGALIGNDN